MSATKIKRNKNYKNYKLSCLKSETNLLHFPNSHSFYWKEKKKIAWLEVQNSCTVQVASSSDHLHEQPKLKARINNKKRECTLIAKERLRNFNNFSDVQNKFLSYRHFSFYTCDLWPKLTGVCVCVLRQVFYTI